MTFNKIALFSLSAFTFLNSVPSFALDVICNPRSGGSWFLEVKGNGMASMKVSFMEAAGEGDNQTIVEIGAEDIFRLEQGSQKLNVTAAHHNTEIKLDSSAAVFGQTNGSRGQSWNGKLVVSDNLVENTGSKGPISVTCSSFEQ